MAHSLLFCEGLLSITNGPAQQDPSFVRAHRQRLGPDRDRRNGFRSLEFPIMWHSKGKHDATNVRRARKERVNGVFIGWQSLLA